MNKKMVAYFSAGGVTAGVARTLAEAAGADLYEIKPEVPYTASDLNWMDPNARSTIEMHDLSIRPAMEAQEVDITPYDTIYLGFPIWWYIAPTIINTFLEAHDFTGKTIILFATSGGSGFGKTVENLTPSCPGAVVREGKILRGNVTREELTAWIR